MLQAVRTRFAWRPTLLMWTVSVLALGGALVNSEAALAATWTGHAVIIGISDYPGTENDVPSPADDAREFGAALLRDDEHWDDSNVTVLVDSLATRSNIVNALYIMSDRAAPEDVCVFVFSGHGAPLMAYDSVDYFGCITESDLLDWLETCPSDHVCVILEMCHSGEMDLSSASRGGFVVLASAGEYEYSYETPLLGNSVFVFYLTEALGQAAADADADGFVSAEEAFDYTYSCVIDWEFGQTPQIYDYHDGPLQLVTTGTGDLGRPVTPLDFPLGGGAFYRFAGCSANTTMEFCEQPSSGAIVLAIMALSLFARRRTRCAAGALFGVLLLAGCSGGYVSTYPVRLSTSPFPLTTEPECAPVRVLSGAPGDLSEKHDPEAPYLEASPPWARIGARVGFLVPRGAKQADYNAGPQLGAYLKKDFRVLSLEIGGDLALLDGEQVDVHATLTTLRLDLLFEVHQLADGPSVYLHTGPRLLYDVIRTYWGERSIAEWAGGLAFGVGLQDPHLRCDIRLTYDLPLPSRNLGGFVGIVSGICF